MKPDDETQVLRGVVAAIAKDQGDNVEMLRAFVEQLEAVSNALHVIALELIKQNEREAARSE